MNSNDFILWLRGFIAAVKTPPTVEQWGVLISNLDKVENKPHYQFPQYSPNNGGIALRNVDVTPYKSTTYGDICGCNTKNGGSGICNCTIANKNISADMSVSNISSEYVTSKNVTLTEPLNNISYNNVK